MFPASMPDRGLGPGARASLGLLRRRCGPPEAPETARRPAKGPSHRLLSERANGYGETAIAVAPASVALKFGAAPDL